MHYYKKADLAKLYGVNPRTVTRWIDEAERGKLELELHEEGNKYHIAKTAKNQRLIERLTQDRRKYLNRKNLKIVKPLPGFYKTYSEEQILEIFTGIDTDREIDLKFSYLEEGAHDWDTYAKQEYNSDTPNTLVSTIELLNINMSYIKGALKGYSKVNIVDVGVGNALPTKKLISHMLKEQGKLNRYIAIDISNEMLKIAENNITKWFDDKVRFEGYLYDFSVEPFADTIAEPPGGAINLVLMFGGTLANIDTPGHTLKVIRKSLQRNDFFIYCLKLDSPMTRDHLYASENDNQLLPIQLERVLNLLGIDESLYTVEMGYVESERSRIIRIRLKHALTLEFELSRGLWQIDLNKADTVVVWRAKHFTHFEIEDLFYQCGFNSLQKSRTLDNDYLLLMMNKDKRRVV